MKLLKHILLLVVLIGMCDVEIGYAQGPAYASSKTKPIIEKMIEAHGGMTQWKAAPTISYDNIFFNPFTPAGQDPWWVSHEVIEQGRRRVYQYWPLNDAQIVFDGKEVWSTNWSLGNQPKFMTHFFYYFLNLPWLTQDSGIQLGAPEEGILPGYEKTYITVMMTFAKKPTVGKTTKDAFKLYIDPDTYLLQGYEYSFGYGAMLDLMGMPAEMEVMGPILRIHDAFATVDGLVMPARFHTGDLSGETIYGHHIVTNYAFDAPFKTAWMKKPANATVDTSSPVRSTN